MKTLPLSLLSALTVVAFVGCTDTTPVDPAHEALAPQLAVSLMTSSVHWLDDLSKVPGASARLNRTKSSVSFTFRTKGFEKGHVATLWWVIFNNPEACVNPTEDIGAECGIPDLFEEEVAPSVMFAAGNIVGGSGMNAWGGSLREGEITTYHPAFDGAPPLMDAQKAEIHLVARTHGPLIPELAHGMLTTFEVGCTPETSAGFGSGPNECADLQAAAFPAP